MKMSEILCLSPVIPVVRLTKLEQCGGPLADTLLTGGIRIIEVTLRSDIALQAISKLAAEFLELIVGGGTILSTKNALDAINNGARFIVSPGVNLDLENNLDKIQVPFLPGTSSVSEMMKLLGKGFRNLKFFPQRGSGGIGFLKAIHLVLLDFKFCPTEGTNEKNAKDWLALPNVIYIGGSLNTTDKLILDKKWEEIRNRASWVSKLEPKPKL